MNEGIIKDAYELIIQKIQTIISVLYLLMIGIGMLFNHYKYQAFGINIFDFADIFDFLIAPFRDSKIIIASILALVIPSLTYFVDISVNKKFPDWYTKANFGWNKKAWYNKFRYFSFLFLYLFLLFEVASGYGHHLRHSIYKKNDVTIIFADKTTKKGKMIGKTKEMLFLLEKESVSVIPLSSLVKEIKIK